MQPILNKEISTRKGNKLSHTLSILKKTYKDKVFDSTDLINISTLLDSGYSPQETVRFVFAQSRPIAIPSNPKKPSHSIPLEKAFQLIGRRTLSKVIPMSAHVTVYHYFTPFGKKYLSIILNELDSTGCDAVLYPIH